MYACIHLILFDLAYIIYTCFGRGEITGVCVVQKSRPAQYLSPDVSHDEWYVPSPTRTTTISTTTTTTTTITTTTTTTSITDKAIVKPVASRYSKWKTADDTHIYIRSFNAQRPG